MKTAYREPVKEEGQHNIILQNRCGNRLTLLVHPDHTELEFVYKPNAFRRKEFRARNFSSRDNQTTLFQSFAGPDITAEDELEFGYDPFHTVIKTAHEAGARNRLQVLNLADENAFVLTARSPLLLAFKPHGEFTVRDGVITEGFHERGEDIVSFVVFGGFEENRYRVLDDGTHILQILENDPVIIGGEENRAQVDRLLRKWRGMDFEALRVANEEQIARDLRGGRITLADPDFQAVYDINRRVSWSGLDAGGACFGAINRIYYLIWVRDGSMSTAHMALAGNPAFSRIWAPFLFANPSRTRLDDGRVIEEFGQMVGTRWSKAEDDGLFYAAWSLFTHFRLTGDESLLRNGALDLLLRVVEQHLEKCWNAELGMMISDTLGEESLRGSPYFGYDVVNGKLQAAHGNTEAGGRVIERVASFYHQVNTYNVLMMTACLLQAVGRTDEEPFARVTGRAAEVARCVRENFVTPEGECLVMQVFFEEGSTEKLPLRYEDSDFWEMTWAVSQGPFFPLPEAQIRTGLKILEIWPKRERRSYGLCPWNVLNRFLLERGAIDLSTQEANFQEQVREALMTTETYPMRGALHEDHKNPYSLRGLPFSAGAFTVAQTGRLLSPLAQGLAIRAGGMTREIQEFQFRLSSLNVRKEGSGSKVRSWTLNGQVMARALQIPEMLLRPGANEVVVQVGEPEEENVTRLYASDAQLLSVHEEPGGMVIWQFSSVVPVVLRFEGDASKARAVDARGDELEIQFSQDDRLAGTEMHLTPGGEFYVKLDM